MAAITKTKFRIAPPPPWRSYHPSCEHRTGFRALNLPQLDRLARSLKDLLNTLDQVSKAGAGFRVLDTPALDTTTPYGQLILNVLGALAQFERSLIISRTSYQLHNGLNRGLEGS